MDLQQGARQLTRRPGPCFVGRAFHGKPATPSSIFVHSVLDWCCLLSVLVQLGRIAPRRQGSRAARAVVDNMGQSPGLILLLLLTLPDKKTLGVQARDPMLFWYHALSPFTIFLHHIS